MRRAPCPVCTLLRTGSAPQRQSRNKDKQKLCLFQHQNQTHKPIFSGAATCVLWRWVRRAEQALQRRKEGWLFIYFSLSRAVFCRLEPLPSLFTKFSPGIVRIAARGSSASGAQRSPHHRWSFLLLLLLLPDPSSCSGGGRVEEDTGKTQTGENTGREK